MIVRACFHLTPQAPQAKTPYQTETETESESVSTVGVGRKGTTKLGKDVQGETVHSCFDLPMSPAMKITLLS